MLLLLYLLLFVPHFAPVPNFGCFPKPEGGWLGLAMVSRIVSLILAYVLTILAATPAEWRSRIIYQAMTDRFARTDGSTTVPCNVEDYAYCGGTWQGLIDKLDYIQDMGFTAVPSNED